jgi:hypothetical protein
MQVVPWLLQLHQLRLLQLLQLFCAFLLHAAAFFVMLP